ncbi:Por secretion system C-terminal sorting domain-containing protein [Flavobacterium swingsii]|uniref:Por secretion system C-terminal sorting domain-containing protein n=1 Tax=Flavobacterium swingsii TaxID=498292 RepID=A0A1I0XSY1_9FLAO|nr:LamG-like jellyroll fold domain-containing protein [Flavobacterium swingsii]SFB04259.1 Por secretion system C-terminal sorting domain-containing protein [Flavobacterium swingsii]
MKTRLLLFMLLAFSHANSQVTAGLIQQFKFDNSYANVAGTTSFSATSFDFDRSGHPNSAVRMTYALQSQATIPGLPYGNAARTISFWVKSIADAGLNYGPVFSYGTGTTGNAFGGGVSTDRTMMVSHNDDYTLIMGGNPNTLNVWYHFVMTYDGTTAKMYRNGQLMGSMAKSWNTINNSDIFKLGVGTGGQQWFNGLIDDLRVYDRAVTDAEALQIYNEPSTRSIGLIKSFSFNNSPADDTNTVSFTTSNASFPITYTASRNAAGQAMVTTASATRTCTIPNLPLGKTDRTISFWCNHSTFSPITSFASFGYGASSQYNTFGFYLGSSSVNFQGFSYDQPFTTGAIAPFTWYFIAVVFENDNAKIFINGQYFGPVARPLLNTTLTSFRIGAFEGAVDDLKIYDRALSHPEILGLYSKPAVTVTTYPTTHNSATINYTMSDFGLNTTSLVRYGLSSGNLSSQATGTSTTGNGTVNGSANLSGLLPNTTYYFQVEATNSSGTTTSPILSFTTQSQAPGIYSVAASSITTNSASIDYSAWDKGLATTTVVKYGLSSGNLTNQVTGFSVSGDTTISGNVSLTGLTPATTYYYQVEATNTAGVSTSTEASFNTLALPSQIANYPFNNSLNNAGGTNPFSAPNTTFVADRNSQVTSAVRIGSTTTPSTATIPNLPIGTTERTISFWHKKPTHATAIGLFAYGTGGSLQTFGIYLLANGNYVFQGSVTDVAFTGSATAANTWINTVVTYKSGVVKLYNNGVFVGSTNLNLNTGSSTFRLGGNQAIVEFDDLQFYNYELSASQVGELHNNNVLASSNFSQNNLKVAFYPNPVRDILNIETDTEIKSVEVYNLQGQKVFYSNQKQVNISDLASGIYMIRIEDTNNAVETKRIVKE